MRLHSPAVSAVLRELQGFTPERGGGWDWCTTASMLFPDLLTSSPVLLMAVKKKKRVAARHEAPLYHSPIGTSFNSPVDPKEGRVKVGKTNFFRFNR